MSYFTPITTALSIIGLPIVLYFAYMLLLSLPGLLPYHKYSRKDTKTKFAVLVAARNEAGVIGQLIDSLKQSNYPKDLFDIWAIPNNCTDNTKETAQEHGALIFEPTGPIHSKGDALKEFFDHILRKKDIYDAFVIFDADNIVDPDFLNRMNDAILDGELIAQGYRESKNPKDSWISGSQTMFYWITNRFLNRSRRALGMSAVLNGTGFMVTRELLLEQGFSTYTLTEDIEYSTQTILSGKRIAFVSEAKTYDEHPIDFKTSWKQRKRWSTGIIETLYQYSPQLFRKFRETKKWIYFDMILYLVAPYMQVLAFFYTVSLILIYTGIALYSGGLSIPLIGLIGGQIFTVLFSVFYTGFSVLYEKHSITDCALSTYMSFWWFLTSWIFINIDVFRHPLESWEPIEHNRAMSVSDLKDLAPTMFVSK